MAEFLNPQSECAYCERHAPAEECRECPVCKKDFCDDCLYSCGCGCNGRADEDCMVKFDSRYWLPACLAEHARLLREAGEEIEAARVEGILAQKMIANKAA